MNLGDLRHGLSGAGGSLMDCVERILALCQLLKYQAEKLKSLNQVTTAEPLCTAQGLEDRVG